MTKLALLAAATFFMEFLDATILTTALPKMAQSLGVAPVDLSVGVSIYALTLAVFILPGAWAVERYGARAMFAAAILLFTAASALCGFSTSAGFFVAARALQGIGGAFMAPVGRLVVLRTTPKSGILQATALLTWPALAAPLIGPPLGGFLAEAVSWRAIFFVNLPLGLIGAALGVGVDPEVREKRGQAVRRDGLRAGGNSAGRGAVGAGCVRLARGGAGPGCGGVRPSASCFTCGGRRIRS